MKLLNLKNKRKATKDDFKLGTTLFDSEGNSFTLKNEYAEGIGKVFTEYILQVKQNIIGL